MATVLDMIDNLKSLNIEKEALVAIGKTGERILDLNRDQLLDGKKSNGKVMPAYSDMSVEVYGKPSGPIRLYDTGAFQESFKIDVDSLGLQILSDDPNDLAGAYGDDIFGLTTKNQEYYNKEIFLPVFMDAVKNETGL